MKINKRILIIILGCVIALAISSLLNFTYYEEYKLFYSSEDFGITVIKSDVDANNNGIDDYTDILLGAKKDAKNHPTYKSAYYAGGYPKDDEGVCTDVIWRALKEAGYSLKDLMDEDIKNNIEAYSNITIPDPNIDFRRVVNIYTYLERHALKLTDDLSKINEWQPGDIVVFKNHIAIISDKRNKKGIPYIIHNAGQPKREEDTLLRWYHRKGILGHYRFVLH